MQVRRLLGLCSFRGLGCARQEPLGGGGTWRGSLRAVGGRGAGCFLRPHPLHGLHFALWLISEVACHCGELQRQLPGLPAAPAAAAGKVLREGDSQGLGKSWERQKEFCRERMMLALVPS